MTGIKVTDLSEEEIERICREIGDSFYDHKCGVKKDGTTEYGMRNLINSREKMYRHMKACFVAGYESGCLYSTSERGEGYIIVTYKGHDISFKSGIKMIRAIVKNLGGIRKEIKFLKRISGGGATYEEELKKKKIPYVNLGMLVVLKEYQGQGYMRKVMEMAFAEGNRLQIPVILDTDAKSKCNKYMHLGMELAGTRDLGQAGKLYDLIKYPDI